MKSEKSEIEIREAESAEWQVIAGFQIKMAKETEDELLDSDIVSEGVQAVFNNPELGRYYVAEAEGHIIASLLITCEWSDWRNAFVWWLQSVYVIPAYRKMGVFRKMYRHIQQQAIQRRDVAGIRLYMVSENHTAGQVYQKMGMDGKKYRMFEWMK
jgi:GNAT superfamily N-acetyltransferase